jgi:PKHD-type hydroxylase
MSAILIEKVIPADRLSSLRQITAAGPYVAGRLTAVGAAAGLKQNLQLAPDSAASAKAVEMLVGILNSNAAFQAATWVDAMMTPLFARYAVGMTYGDHIDGALMGQAPDVVRCDIAVTVCLNDASDYEGGALVIDAAGVPRSWRGNAGDCLIYPADTLHRVEPVTRGTREVAVIWIQSMVRDSGRRRILFDLRVVLDELERSSVSGPHVETLRRSYYNLIRMWA